MHSIKGTYFAPIGNDLLFCCHICCLCYARYREGAGVDLVKYHNQFYLIWIIIEMINSVFQISTAVLVYSIPLLKTSSHLTASVWYNPWWRHQMETFSTLLALCVLGIQWPLLNSPLNVICALNKRLSKLSWSWWFQEPSRSLWRHYNAVAFLWL